LNLDLMLTPEEAARGVLVRVGVPVFALCPACSGTGSRWGLPCLTCGQEGTVEHQETVPLRVPALVAPGTVFEIPLHQLGIRNTCLRLHVSVSG
jgi:DnaJ-class molecular chaperone